MEFLGHYSNRINNRMGSFHISYEQMKIKVLNIHLGFKTSRGQLFFWNKITAAITVF